MISAQLVPPTSRRRVEPTHYYVILSGIRHSRDGSLLAVTAVLSYALWLVLCLTFKIWWVWWIVPIPGIAVLLAAFSVVVLRREYRIVYPPVHPTLFSQLYADIVSRQFFQSLLHYTAASNVFYIVIKSIMSNMSYMIMDSSDILTAPRFNERYVYVTCYAFYVSLVYSVWHQLNHYNVLPFKFRYIPRRPRKAVFESIPGFSKTALLLAAVCAFSFPIVYAMFVRASAWYWFTKIARIFTNMSHSTGYIKFPARPGLVISTFFTSFLLLWAWEMANTGATIYMTLGPSHKNKFISDLSKDPNGTLLTGLRAKENAMTRILAFQELLDMAKNRPQRSKLIFREIDRQPRSTWKQILEICLGEIETVHGALETALQQAKIDEQKKHFSHQQQEQQQQQNLFMDGAFGSAAPPTSPEFLRRRAVNPLKEERRNIFRQNTTTPRTIRLAESLQDKDAQMSFETIGMFKTLWAFIQEHSSVVGTKIEILLGTPLGMPFRHTVHRQLRMLIPNLAIPEAATMSLAYLVSLSLSQDDYGTVQRDIPRILSELDSTLTILHKYIISPPIHWTNVLVRAGQEQPNVKLAHTISNMMDAAFTQIVSDFSPFLNELGLSESVMARAHHVLRETSKL